MTYRLPFEVPELTYGAALETLHAALTFGIQPLLETVVDMLAELGGPDRCFRAVQIAGTNGKTSTARYTAAVLAGEGLRCALYTSPELVSYTERMEIDGHPVGERAFAHGIAAAHEAGLRVNARRSATGERPYDVTEFDTLTVAACVLFAEAGVDVAVLECGMGGRWDATSAVGSIESVAVTGVGLDHTRILGDTLEAIAGEKAAIIKRGRGCVLGVGTTTPASVEDVFLGQCACEGVVPTLLRPEDPADATGEMRPGAPRPHAELPHASYRVTRRPRRLGFPVELTVTTPRTTYAGLAALKPTYQAANIACAVALAEGFLGRALDQDRLYEGVVACPTPGRFQLVRPDPPLLIDACHNPQSVATFLSSLEEMAPSVQERPALLCAVLADKDAAGMAELLALAFLRVYVTQTTSPRALPARELGLLFVARGRKPVDAFPSVSEALRALSHTPLVACGSITLAGEVAAQLR